MGRKRSRKGKKSSPAKEAPAIATPIFEQDNVEIVEELPIVEKHELVLDFSDFWAVWRALGC
jgi:hypothetical protein